MVPTAQTSVHTTNGALRISFLQCVSVFTGSCAVKIHYLNRIEPAWRERHYQHIKRLGDWGWAGLPVMGTAGYWWNMLMCWFKYCLWFTTHNIEDIYEKVQSNWVVRSTQSLVSICREQGLVCWGGGESKCTKPDCESVQLWNGFILNFNFNLDPCI